MSIASARRTIERSHHHISPIQISHSNTRQRPAARYARALIKLFRPENGGTGECRVPVAPAAARGVVNTRVSHHGYTGSPGIPARNGFNGFLRALPGDRALLSPSLANRIRKLDASVEASGPHDFAVRRKRFRQRRCQRPSHPFPTFVTIAKRPSEGRDGMKYGFDLG